MEPSTLRSTEVTPSSVTLASLPTELHSLIARMCRDQDRQYKVRTSPEDFGIRHLEVAKAGATDWDGRSLSALSLSSRDWRTATAPYFFETISSNSCDDALFLFEISPKYASLVRHALFDHHATDSTGQAALLRTLPFLPRLQSLAITPPVFVHLLGLRSTSTPTAEQSVHQQGLRSLLRSIAELSLVDVRKAELAWILPSLSRTALRRLDLTLDLDSDDASIQPARTALSKLKGLQHLSLRDLNVDMAGLLEDVEAFEFELKSLELGFYDRSFDAEAWTFVIGQAQHGEGTPRVRFEVLRDLRLEGTITSIATAINLFSSSPITTLSLRVLEYQNKTKPDPLDALLANIAKGREMRRQVTAVIPQLDLSVEPRYDPFYHRPPNAGSVGLERACDAATETLKFGLDLSDHLLATKDFDGAKALIELLLPLRGKMLRLKD
ncbi:hypothetical protein BCR35DRAFT_331026 [Leucosporidium creatinivorum]|uniref:Uncharacterized protein n=1 Tax=Leucosporidium creatinivorum TaxID=106004 RepID=A0A1Y2FJG3_9BASI|nr:hypothetical protein BCR35DRAFT_331026 [Leucosporidium creatinivorum]